MAGVVVAERQHLGARQPRAGPQARMRQLIDQDQVAAADQRRGDAGVGEIARAEHAGGLGALEPRQPLLQLGVERMIAGDEPRGAGADAVALDRRDGGGLQRRMLAQAEIIVAGERQQPPAVALDPEIAEPAGRHERAAQVRLLQRRKLLPCEFIERGHVCTILAPNGSEALVRGRPRSRLAALYADEDGAAAAGGGAHRGLPHRARRRPRADRRHRVVVDRLPRLQPSAHPAGGGAAARRHAACDVRRAGARAGFDPGAAACGAAAGRSRSRVLLGIRLGRGRDRDEDGAAILDQSRRAEAAPSSSRSRAAITATPPARWR